MKKLIVILVIASVFASCKKDSDTIELGEFSISFSQGENIIVEIDDAVNKKVAFDIILNKVAPQDISALLTINSESNAIEGTHFLIASKALTVKKDSIKLRAEIEIISAGISATDSLNLILNIESSQVKTGSNNQIQLIIKRKKSDELVSIFSEGFEGGEIPSGWQAINVDGKIPNSQAYFYPATTWVVTNNVAAGIHTGTYAAGNNSWVADESGGDDWLITSGIDLLSNNVLKFFVISTSADYKNNCKVYISTSSTQSSFSVSLKEEVAVPKAWQEISISIPSAYNNQKVYIAFRDDSNGDAIVLDDISIVGK